MDIQNMKNIVVLKNLPSNMIEEAFVVLKDNVKIHKQELAQNKKGKTYKASNKDYVVKEAEMILKEYATSIENKGQKGVAEKVKLQEECKRLKYLSLFLGLFSALSLMLIILK